MDGCESAIEGEDTPLLDSSRKQEGSSSKPTPLPRLQIAIVLLLQIFEAITNCSIYPYINQLVSELDIIGGDKNKVGYYTGLIQSLFYATEAITVLQWSRASDYIGRKPVILTGLVGTSLSMICFGFSRTFWTLVMSRCLYALLSGNIGVTKSLLGDITDTTNRAEGFALMRVVWAVGSTVGSLIGGSLSRPQDQYPNVFTSPFWKDYPYLLPCVAATSFGAIPFFLTAFMFKETLLESKSRPEPVYTSFDTTLAKHVEPEDEPLPIRQLFTYPVVLSALNYVTLAFLNMSVYALLPLFFAMPVEIGGLNFDPPTIGYVMSLYGAGGGIFQGLFFSKIVGHFGPRRVFVFGISTFIPVFALCPVMSLIAKSWGITFTVYVLVACVMFLLILNDMAYGCIFIYITATAPNKRSLGTINGICQTPVSISRAIGPALSTSLFSFSVQRNILGGYGVYAILIVLTVLFILLAMQLPSELWKERSSREESEAG